jgi:hypothetical protein
VRNLDPIWKYAKPARADVNAVAPANRLPPNVKQWGRDLRQWMLVPVCAQTLYGHVNPCTAQRIGDTPFQRRGSVVKVGCPVSDGSIGSVGNEIVNKVTVDRGATRAMAARMKKL